MSSENLSVILSIPEIQSGLRLQLEYRDLETCQYVCRTWRNIFTPLVWQKRPLSILGAIKHHEDPESLDMLQRYGRYVRHLTIHRVYMLDTISQFLQNITYLHIIQQLNVDQGDYARWPQLVAFMAVCPRLDTLVIHTKLRSILGQFAQGLCRAVGNRLHKLTIFMASGQIGCTTDLVDLVVGLPSLVELQVYSSGQWQIDHDEGSLGQRVTRLQVLEIYDHQGRLITHSIFPCLTPPAKKRVDDIDPSILQLEWPMCRDT